MRQDYIKVRPKKKYQPRQLSKEDQEELMLQKVKRQSLKMKQKEPRKPARQTVNDKVFDQLLGGNQGKYEEEKQPDHQFFYDEDEVIRARVSFIQEEQEQQIISQIKGKDIFMSTQLLRK